MSLPLSPPGAQAAIVGDVAGRSVVLHYGDPVREYEALRSGAMLVDRGERLRLYADGAAAAETLTGLVTNDVTGLSVGEGCYACALTPKGRIIADVRVFALGDARLLLDASPRAAEGFTAMLRKYVNPRLAKITDVSDELRDIGLFGVQSRRVVAELTGIPAPTLQLLALYGHLGVEIDGRALLVARVPDLGLEGYELFGDAELLHELAVRATALGATPTGLDAWTVARIEAGRPEWGLDVDDTTIPQEANMDDLHAISYTKGCYTGQEVVARVHFRGHVNRHLRGLRTTHEEPLPHGAQLVDENGRVLGDVRSAVLSPRLGNLALAMVRREVAAGTTVRAAWEGGGADVTVWPLPFPL
jgi:folate-binding protein YgfZ